MEKQMNSRNIGKIISVSSKGVRAEIYNLGSNYINTVDGIRFVGQVGSYVSIYEPGRIVIGEIVSVDEAPNISYAKNSKPLLIRYINISPLGEIISEKFIFGVSKMPLIYSEVNIISEKDLAIMLEVSDDEETINENYTRLKLLELGTSVLFDNYKVKVNIDKFFGFHFAVFGNTGSGKSNTIACILQTIFKKKSYSAYGAKFVIIDSNGEYKKSFEKINENNNDINAKFYSAVNEDLNNNENHIEIPVWELTADDWAILLHATEKTQVPILKRAIDIAKIFYGNDESPDEKTDIIKNHILASALIGIFNSADTSVTKADKMSTILTKMSTTEISLETKLYFTAANNVTKIMTLCDALKISFGQIENTGKVITFLKSFIKPDIFNEYKPKNAVYTLEDFCVAVDFAILYEGSISSQRIHEYTATLNTRLQALVESEQGKLFTKTKFSSVEEYINDLLGNNQILNIDVSGLDDASAETVAKVMAKLLLDYLKGKSNKADMPVNFIIEEAHRYVKSENNYGALGYNIFERIAKEGRKYGLLLCISSQRPSELSKTVVSQCSNFIVHRVQNPDDLQYISRMVPYINQNIIDQLTYLQTGTALVFGAAINIPTLTNFAIANPKTDSDNAKISEKWYIEKAKK